MELRTKNTFKYPCHNLYTPMRTVCIVALLLLLLSLASAQERERIPPVVTISSPSGSVNSPFTLRFVISDEESGINKGSTQYQLDGGELVDVSPADCSGDCEQPGGECTCEVKGIKAPDGEHTIKVHVWDRKLNPTSRTLSFLVGLEDIIPPIIMGAFPRGIVADMSPIITLDTNEIATCKGSADKNKKPYDEMDFTFSTKGTYHDYKGFKASSEGTHKIYAICKDTSGNVMESSYSWEFIIQMTGEVPPTISDIEVIPSDTFYTGTEVSFIVSEKDSRSGLIGNIALKNSLGEPSETFPLTDNRDGTYSYEWDTTLDFAPGLYNVSAILTDILELSDDDGVPFILISVKKRDSGALEGIVPQVVITPPSEEQPEDLKFRVYDSSDTPGFGCHYIIDGTGHEVEEPVQNNTEKTIKLAADGLSQGIHELTVKCTNDFDIEGSSTMSFTTPGTGSTKKTPATGLLGAFILIALLILALVVLAIYTFIIRPARRKKKPSEPPAAEKPFPQKLPDMEFQAVKKPKLYVPRKDKLKKSPRKKSEREKTRDELKERLKDMLGG
jgi:hypothetical protein